MAKYYLKVNGIIIGLNHINGLEKVDDFLNLSIFTGCFTSENALINQLKKWYLIPEDFEKRSIGITRKVGNKKDGYSFEPQNFKIVYSSTLSFMDLSTIKKFIQTNIRNTDFIEKFSSYFGNTIVSERNILDAYALKNKIFDKMKPKIDYLNIQLNTLSSLIGISVAYDKASSEKDEEAKSYYLNIFNNSLSKFLEYYLINKDKNKDNYKNLSIMASFITNELGTDNTLINILGTNKYNKQKKEYKEIIGKMISKKKSVPLIFEESKEDEHEEFLTLDDFSKLPSSSEKLEESREVAIENFLESTKYKRK